MADLELTIKVISSPCEPDSPFAVIYKPAGLPSAPLKEGENSALTQAIKFFPQIKSVTGKKPVEYGLLHRIDTATEGLLLIATTQESFNCLEKQQKEGKFIKYYKAIIETKSPVKNKTITVTSKFRPFGPKGKMVKPVFENGTTADLKKCGNKNYTTEIIINGNTAICSIKEGYRHQVRAHLASIGYPIIGDFLYNPGFSEKYPLDENNLQFKAIGFKFEHPVTRKIVEVRLKNQ